MSEGDRRRSRCQRVTRLPLPLPTETVLFPPPRVISLDTVTDLDVVIAVSYGNAVAPVSAGDFVVAVAAGVAVVAIATSEAVVSVVAVDLERTGRDPEEVVPGGTLDVGRSRRSRRTSCCRGRCSAQAWRGRLGRSLAKCSSHRFALAVIDQVEVMSEPTGSVERRQT